jgi:cysteine synthase A
MAEGAVTAAVLTEELLKTQLVPQILASVPADWRGTTFNNSNLLGREAFSERLLALLVSKAGTKLGEEGAITADDLSALGNAEDYLRVATNFCCTYETVMAQLRSMSIEQVFSFSSTAMPVIAVLMTQGAGGKSAGEVHLYHGESEPAPFSEAQVAQLALLGGTLVQHAGNSGAPADHGAAAVLSTAATAAAGVHALVGDRMLYIVDTTVVRPHDVLVMRKRMAIPATTPVCEAWLQAFCGAEQTADAEAPTPDELAGFNAHLQTLSGTAVNVGAQPVTFAAGLPTLASLWLTLVKNGGADVLMCSTAYGGSSELMDIFNDRGGKIIKSKFHIQGDAPIDGSIQTALDALPPSDLPAMVLFVEIPTNPDQKIPDLAKLAASCLAFEARTGKAVMLLVDTTFAPGSEILGKLQAHAPSLKAMVFVSMSKSVSRGLTTAGALVANHTDYAVALINEVAVTAAWLDTTGRRDQMLRLCRNHAGVKTRCESAYAVTVAVGDALRSSVAKHAAGFDMPLSYVRPEHAATGFTSSTFSFNLPSPQGATEEVLAGLAQRFVDLLTDDKEHFKPCVSFGQDNSLVYCTVPATSTQGAIAAEDKAKQAVGGVQLVRLSFPPTIDVAAVQARVEMAVAAAYA